MPNITPPEARHGWMPTPEHNLPSEFAHLKRSKAVIKQTEALAEEMPPFFIANQTVASDRVRAVLWDATKKILGKHLWILQQEDGSCVGQGAENAGMYVTAVEIVAGDRQKFEMLFLPYHYGRGRLHAGIRGSGAGSTGSGQAKAVMEDGVLFQSLHPDLPKPSGGDGGLTWGYSVERQWSNGAKISDALLAKGRKHPIKTTAKVVTYEQVRDALANGYPVTVASMQGFQMRPVVDKGKHWGRPSGQWAHQMTFIGVDDDPARPGCYCQNSWGADAHGQPADDAPPGGFWVDADVVTKMVRQNDSFAYSQFEGFPEQAIDWSMI